jgi:hypothetical protein
MRHDINKWFSRIAAAADVQRMKYQASWSLELVTAKTRK